MSWASILLPAPPFSNSLKPLLPHSIVVGLLPSLWEGEKRDTAAAGANDLALASGIPYLHPGGDREEMAEKGKAQPPGPAKGEAPARVEEKVQKPDLIRDLWREKAKLKLHLTDGTVLTGRIQQFDPFNIQLVTDSEQLYLIPKHAVVYVEL